MRQGECGSEVGFYRWIRVISCLAVVVLHCVYVSYRIFERYMSREQIRLSNLVVDQMMWAVPCFLMVTGALLLNPQRKLPLSKVLTKYIPKVLGALFFFGLVFSVFDAGMDQKKLGFWVLAKGLEEILKGTGWSHLWYLYLLIGLYLLMPFLQKAVRLCSMREIEYLVILLFVFQSLLPFLRVLGVETGFYIPVSQIYPLYLILGYWLANKDIQHPGRWGAGLLLAGSAVIALLICRGTTKQLQDLSWLWGYASFLVVAQASGVFLLFRRLEQVKVKGSFWIRKIDEYSFGIYLIHMIFVRLLFRYWQWNPYGQVFLFIPAILGIFLLSAGITAILKKLPLVRRIL